VKGLDTLEMGSPFGFTGNYPLYLTSRIAETRIWKGNGPHQEQVENFPDPRKT
jgi:hypothetical protein